MNTGNKRKEAMDDDKTSKRVKKVCSYGETCFRRNPAHFREFSHPHLESILDAHKEGEDYPIPPELSLQRHMIQEQLEIIVEKKLYEPIHEKLPVEADTPKKLAVETNIPSSSGSSTNVSKGSTSNNTNTIKDSNEMSEVKKDVESVEDKQKNDYLRSVQEVLRMPRGVRCEATKTEKQDSSSSKNNYKDDPNYRPILPPTRKAEEYLKVVRPRGQMAEKHKARAPYYIFYTTITDAKETHSQPYSITFQEILDSSLGELKCSLQINFMVEIAWLLAQYYFAGYSLKKLTILYGDDCTDMRDISKKKPQVEAVHIKMPMPFGTHHTKMMILCYEDGSLRVVISTANLYLDDWENRTQGLWFSPSCPELPPEAMPHDGESPTLFKKYLLKYLNNYHLPQLAFYVERVKRCDFSHINVFLVSSAPGSHFDADWGLTRVGALLRQHCAIPRDEHRSWNFLAQASSLGSFGKEARLWLTGDFLHNFSKIKEQPQTLSSPPELKLIYPSLENVRQSHDNLLGGGCLPYGANVHMKQTWLNNYMYQWKATSTNRNKAMPHIKCYTRVSGDCARAGYFVLSSANVSKAAWGGVNKGDGALRLLNYEAGVLLLPRFVINEDFFPLKEGAANRLILPYDVPPVKYTADMSPWVSDYLR